VTKAKGKTPRKRRQKLLIEGTVADQVPKDTATPLDAAAFDALCAHIAEGNSLRAWAREANRPVATVAKWILSNEDRTKLYREARKMQADAHIDDIIELSDSPVPVDDQGRTDSAAVNQLRLRVDTRKWIASKYHPAMYGEKVDVNATFRGADQKPDEILARITALLAAHGLRIAPADPTEP
jgi:hypothetical protein